VKTLIFRTLILLLTGVWAEHTALADIILFSGTTVDSHFSSASNDNLPATVLQLVYNSTSFDSQEAALPLSLGSFTLGQKAGSSRCAAQSSRASCTDDYSPYAFQLALSLGVPVDGLTLPAIGQISGTVGGRLALNPVTRSVSGHLDILFSDTPTLFTFTGDRAFGSFNLIVDDLLDLKPNQTAPLRGTISNLQITHVPDHVTAQVPETASIALLAAMLVGAAVTLGRFQTRSE
jgi:hypothetical protein